MSNKNAHPAEISVGDGVPDVPHVIPVGGRRPRLAYRGAVGYNGSE